MEHGYVDGAYVESCRGSIKHQRRIHTSQTCLKASHRHGHRHSLLHPVHSLDACVNHTGRAPAPRVSRYEVKRLPTRITTNERD